MTLQLADKSFRYPKGILMDVPIFVGKIVIPCDFVVMDIPEDKNTPVILGRPCLAIAGALIDVKRGKLTLEVGDDKVEFELQRAMRHPSSMDFCFQVGIVEKEAPKSVWETEVEEIERLLEESSANDKKNAAINCAILEDSLHLEDIKEESSPPPKVELNPLTL